MQDANGQIQIISAETVDIKRRLELLEASDQRHDESIKQLLVHQEGTKVYVTQILQKLDNLETKLFAALTSSAQQSQSERKGWQELVRYVISVTIAVIVLYLFQMGGSK